MIVVLYKNSVKLNFSEDAFHLISLYLIFFKHHNIITRFLFSLKNFRRSDVALSLLDVLDPVVESRCLLSFLDFWFEQQLALVDQLAEA